MKRIYAPPAYNTAPDCFWHGSVTAPRWQPFDGPSRCDVAVIGGGFTGLVAALHLAREGVDVALLEAGPPGFGASTRNGGFCCIGGAKASHATLARLYGADATAQWHATEQAAIGTVAELLSAYSIDAECHSAGETQLAHTPRAMDRMRAAAGATAARYGVSAEIVEAPDLARHGLGGAFHGAVTLPLGFALNPARYHAGLGRAAQEAGARLHARSAVTSISQKGAVWQLGTTRGPLEARRVIIATNGYSSEDLPPWLRARYLPVQSNVLVTRPLSTAERDAQGWTSRQMAYDSRVMLHYFRLLPDNRFLFGMRGGLSATAGADRALRRRILRHFHALFPEWRDIDIAHNWSGLLCLMARLHPFAGAVPEMPGVFAGLGFHGNGVAMGSHTGMILADLAQGKTPRVIHPDIMTRSPRRFPLGRFRRALLAPAYLAAGMMDL